MAIADGGQANGVIIFLHCQTAMFRLIYPGRSRTDVGIPAFELLNKIESSLVNVRAHAGGIGKGRSPEHEKGGGRDLEVHVCVEGSEE